MQGICTRPPICRANPAAARESRHAHFALAPHFRTRDRRIFFVQDSDGGGYKKVPVQSGFIALHEAHVIVGHRGCGTPPAVKRMQLEWPGRTLPAWKTMSPSRWNGLSRVPASASTP